MTEIENIERGSTVTIENDKEEIRGNVLIANDNSFELQLPSPPKELTYLYCRLVEGSEEKVVEVFEEQTGGSSFLGKYTIKNHYNPFGDSDI
jgi:hypothetical protein